jgi:hypothetical protein
MWRYAWTIRGGELFRACLLDGFPIALVEQFLEFGDWV